MKRRDLFAPPPELEGRREGSRFEADVEHARQEANPERDAFLASDVGERIRARLLLSAARERRRRRLAVAAAAAAGLATLALGVLLALPADRGEESLAPGIRTPDRILLKGGSALFVYRKRGEEVAAVRDGTVLRPGDKLRFAYRATLPYLMVVNVESAGGIAPFYPFPAGASLAIRTGERAELEGSIELDASAGTERIVALFSAAPLSFAQVRGELERVYPRVNGRRDLSPAPPLGLDAEVVSVRVEKRAGGAR